MDFDFSFFLVAATFVTGGVWGAYGLFRKASRVSNEIDAQKEPIVVEYARSFFPIILIVLILRSFIVEPFRIPSGSMMPTLLIGDFILVNKFAYGIRLPVLHEKIIEMDEPQRGDIVVFRFPKDPTVDYIKRVVGLPGDRVGYYGKKVYINGNLIKQTLLGRYHGHGKGTNMTGTLHLLEALAADSEHSLLIRPGQPSPNMEYVIAPGQYFVMGDNRDNSNDSRYWGTVPEENLVGRAFYVWMNWDLDNNGIAFDRLGTILK